MKLLGRRNDGADDAGAGDSSADSALDAAGPAPETGTARTTAPKGRPTPKRNDKTKKRGPVAPAPMTAAEARQRRKEARPQELLAAALGELKPKPKKSA